eukprot:c18974_g1_i1 orf=26-457(-)
MLQLWKENFHMKIIPKSKMDSTYQHECIQLFSLKSKVLPSLSWQGTSEESPEEPSVDVGSPDLGTSHDRGLLDSSECVKKEDLQSICNDVEALDIHDTNKSLSVDQIDVDASNRMEGKNCNELNDWEIRRLGSMAARLLQNVL